MKPRQTTFDFPKNGVWYKNRCAYETDVSIKHVLLIVAPCILNSAYFTHQQMHYLLTWLKVLICFKTHNNIAPTCFGH